MNTPAPVLKFSGGSLVPFGERHLTDLYVSWLNDANVVRYSELRHASQTRESCVDYFNSLTTAGHYFWAIETTNDGCRHVGNIVGYIDQPNSTVNLTILVGDTQVWGKGIGTAAWIAALDWLLDDGGMRKVSAGTMSCNKPMLSLMSKSGMQQEARLNAQLVLDDRSVDVVIASKLSEKHGLPAYKD